MFRVRIFRAIDDVVSCHKFMEGHIGILKVYGVTQVTSAKTEWFNNENVYVILVETSAGKPVGGIRLHVANNKENLPIELATAEYDPKVFDFIKKYSENGTGELCGLWNAKEVAGMGIGTKYLMRAGISVINQLNLSSLLALCAEHTFQISLEKGFEVEESLGDKGRFYYPKEDLVVTVLIIKNPYTLELADPQERKHILSLRENPVQKKVEISSIGDIEIEYDLKIK